MMKQTSSGTSSSKELFQAEFIISYVLRVGVILCASIIIFGLVLSWIDASSLSRFSKETLPALSSGKIITGVEIPRTPGEFSSGIINLHSDVIIALGLLLLIALPIVRVGLTVLIFIIERDFIYLSITLFVFSILVAGLFLGKAM